MLTVPEYIIYDTIQSLLKFVRADYAGEVDKTKTYLHKLLYGVGFQRYNYLEQAVSVICCPEDDPRKLQVELMFNQERQRVPSIHITLPAETLAPNANGMGTDELEYLFDDGNDVEDIPGTMTAILARRYSATYNVVIMSDNTNEVVFLHHFVKALLTAAIPHLHEKGLQNISLGGRDVNPYNDLSNQMYVRAITMSLQYETSTLSIHPSLMPHDIESLGVPKETLS